MDKMSQGTPRTSARATACRWAALAVIMVSVWFGVAHLRGADAPSPRSAAPLPSSPASPSTGRRETRPTLDPAQFVGKAAEAHRVAREIPDVLDQLYCYCGCDKHQGHKSLLSCYTDGHAAT
jgi:hypothetical protein